MPKPASSRERILDFFLANVGSSGSVTPSARGRCGFGPNAWGSLLRSSYPSPLDWGRAPTVRQPHQRCSCRT